MRQTARKMPPALARKRGSAREPRAVLRHAKAPILQFYVGVVQGGRRSLAQGVNDEANHRDTDTGIGDVEGRPRIGKANM